MASPAQRFTLTNANPTDTAFSIDLYERALPLETMQVGGKMRAEFTWYAGSPVATVQVLGAEEDDISVQGFWKERFIGDPGSGGMLFVGGDPVYSVRVAVDALDAARRRGLPLVMQWGEVVRTVLIKEFTQTWHNPYDCEWELTLGVIAIDTIIAPTPNQPYPDLSATSYNIDTADTYWSTEALQLPAGLRWNADLLAQLNEVDDTVLGLTNAVTNFVQNVVGQATTPLNAARQLGAILTNATRQLETFAFTIMGQAESSIFEGFTSPDTIPYTEQARAAYSKTRISQATRDLRNVFIEQITPQIQLLTPPLTASYIASSAQDLRDVSTQFYGTPNNWRGLMQYNGLSSSRLAAGDLIWVPQQISPNGGSGA